MLATSTTQPNTPAANPSSTSSAQSTAISEIPPLSDDGSDYPQWSTHIQSVLKSHDLWGVTNGTLTKPDQSMDPTRYNTWCQKDHDAKILIAIHLN